MIIYWQDNTAAFAGAHRYFNGPVELGVIGNSAVDQVIAFAVESWSWTVKSFQANEARIVTFTTLSWTWTLKTFTIVFDQVVSFAVNLWPWTTKAFGVVFSGVAAVRSIIYKLATRIGLGW